MSSLFGLPVTCCVGGRSLQANDKKSMDELELGPGNECTVVGSCLPPLRCRSGSGWRSSSEEQWFSIFRRACSYALAIMITCILRIYAVVLLQDVVIAAVLGFL